MISAFGHVRIEESAQGVIHRMNTIVMCFFAESALIKHPLY